ncbi:MAG: prephenate dehydratase [Candidatus Omnitrophica bacterium]|nr:prephenate dehydratase [Candidatus Omnitrophota bacterium]
MNVDQVRKKVDGLDRRILELLNQRAEASKAIGKIKLKEGQGVYAPHREKEVLERLKKLNKGPLTREAIEAIYREIMSFSISLEKKVSIAYLGPAVTYTHQAAQKKFGSSVEYNPCSSISDVFSDVERERCDYGVVPVENSTEGAVNHTLDMFIDSELKMYAEIFLPIHHHLLSIGNPLKSVVKVYSNPQVFGQCRLWLESNLRNADLIDTASTSEAAQIVANNTNHEGLACIASVMAARVYGLKTLASSIEDNPNNTTRFLVISRHEAKPTRADKTSLVFEIKDRAGALHDILVPFKQAGINLTKIESRPSKKKVWSYFFFVDFEGHYQTPRISQALEKLRSHCTFFKVLGSYPRAEG